MPGESKTAVLVIAYRRPKEVQRVLASLHGEPDRRVYVFCDGPKNDQELRLQEEVRRVTEKFSTVHEVLTRFENNHLGLRLGVLTAIDWFFEHEKTGIILEDDVVPSREFFDFCERGLQIFESVDEIQQLVGYNPFGNKLKFLRQHLLTSRMDCWGWATWKNRWEAFREASDFPNSRPDWKWAPKSMVRELDQGRQSAEIGTVDSWAYSWAWHGLAHRKLSVVPAINLVNNIGFNDSATHTKNGRGARPGIMRKTYSFPDDLAPDRAFVYGSQWLKSAQLRWLRFRRKLLRRAKWAGAVLKKFAKLLNLHSRRAEKT